MLKKYKSMTQKEMYTLVHEIYIESCTENAMENDPDASDLLPQSGRKKILLSSFYRTSSPLRKILITCLKRTELL